MLGGMPCQPPSDAGVSTSSAPGRSIPMSMKASRHHADPMEGLWLGMVLCAPVWSVVLFFALR